MVKGSGADWQSLAAISHYHEDATDALRCFFAPGVVRLEERFFNSTEADLLEVLDRRLRETELRSSLAILASIEAAFRLDYETRCLSKMKDPLSRSFRELYKKYAMRVGFEDDVLRLWSEHRADLKRLAAELRSAMKLRHWLAHGRYWEPRLGRKYNFAEVYLLGLDVEEQFPLVER